MHYSFNMSVVTPGGSCMSMNEFLLITALGRWSIEIIIVCPSIRPYFPSTQYLIKAQVENGGMSLNYALQLGLEA